MIKILLLSIVTVCYSGIFYTYFKTFGFNIFKFYNRLLNELGFNIILLNILFIISIFILYTYILNLIRPFR